MRVTARATSRSAVVAIMAVMSAIVLMLPSTITSALNLSAGTALIVPGTGTPDPDASADYVANAINNFVIPSSGANCAAGAGNCNAIPVPYTAQFWPFPFAGWGGLQGAKWNDSVQNGVVHLSTLYGGLTPVGSLDPTDPVVDKTFSRLKEHRPTKADTTSTGE